MAFLKKLTNKANDFIKESKKRQLKNRRTRFIKNQLLLEELKVEAKIKKQQASIATSAAKISKAKEKSSSSTSGFGFGSSNNDEYVNPFGGALGMKRK